MTGDIERPAGPFEIVLTWLYGCNGPVLSGDAIARMLGMGIAAAVTIRASGVDHRLGFAIFGLAQFSILIGSMIEGVRRGRW